MVDSPFISLCYIIMTTENENSAHSSLLVFGYVQRHEKVRLLWPSICTVLDVLYEAKVKYIKQGYISSAAQPRVNVNVLFTIAAYLYVSSVGRSVRFVGALVLVYV